MCSQLRQGSPWLLITTINLSLLTSPDAGYPHISFLTLRSVISLPHGKHVSCYKTWRKSLVYFLMHKSHVKGLYQGDILTCYTECSNAFVALFGCCCCLSGQIKPKKKKSSSESQIPGRTQDWQLAVAQWSFSAQSRGDHGDCKLSSAWTYLLVSPLSTVIALQTCSGGWFWADQCHRNTDLPAEGSQG